MTETEAFTQAMHHKEGSYAQRVALYQQWVAFLPPQSVVYDIGCGDGAWLDCCVAAGHTGIGMDPDPARAKTSPYPIITQDRPDPYPAGITVATAFHVIEHVPPSVAFHWFWTAPVTQWGIITPNWHHPTQKDLFWEDPTHIRPYPSDLIEALLKAAGFTIILYKGSQANDLDTVIWASRG